MKCIILAGGFGTRLRSITGDEIPKCMIKGWFKPGHREVPWLDVIIRNLKSQAITDITLALHYKPDVFINWFGKKLKYKIEEEPLGTGGAIKNCIEGDDPVLVLNGDTFINCDFNEMLANHNKQITVAVTKDGTHAGAYIITPSLFSKFTQKVFSFESDVIPYATFSRYEVEGFVDMGTPAGYQAVQK